MFNQNQVKSTGANKRINSLAALAGKITRSHFATLKSCTQKLHP